MKSSEFREFIDNRDKTVKYKPKKEPVQEAEKAPDNSIDGMEKPAPTFGDSAYFAVLDENTGKRFSIPNLAKNDPEYMFKYIYYMKIRETSPDTFDQIMDWR